MSDNDNNSPKRITRRSTCSQLSKQNSMDERDGGSTLPSTQPRKKVLQYNENFDPRRAKIMDDILDSDSEGEDKSDCGLSYNDHNYLANDPRRAKICELSKFPIMKGLSETPGYNDDESSASSVPIHQEMRKSMETVTYRTSRHFPAQESPMSSHHPITSHPMPGPVQLGIQQHYQQGIARKMLPQGQYSFRPANDNELNETGTDFGTPGAFRRSYPVWAPHSNVTAPKKLGRPKLAEFHDGPPHRKLLSAATYRAGMAPGLPSLSTIGHQETGRPKLGEFRDGPPHRKLLSAATYRAGMVPGLSSSPAIGHQEEQLYKPTSLLVGSPSMHQPLHLVASYVQLGQEQIVLPEHSGGLRDMPGDIPRTLGRTPLMERRTVSESQVGPEMMVAPSGGQQGSPHVLINRFTGLPLTPRQRGRPMGSRSRSSLSSSSDSSVTILTPPTQPFFASQAPLFSSRGSTSYQPRNRRRKPPLSNQADDDDLDKEANEIARKILYGVGSPSAAAAATLTSPIAAQQRPQIGDTMETLLNKSWHGTMYFMQNFLHLIVTAKEVDGMKSKKCDKSGIDTLGKIRDLLTIQRKFGMMSNKLLDSLKLTDKEGKEMEWMEMAEAEDVEIDVDKLREAFLNRKYLDNDVWANCPVIGKAWNETMMELKRDEEKKRLNDRKTKKQEKGDDGVEEEDEDMEDKEVEIEDNKEDEDDSGDDESDDDAPQPSTKRHKPNEYDFASMKRKDETVTKEKKATVAMERDSVDGDQTGLKEPKIEVKEEHLKENDPFYQCDTVFGHFAPEKEVKKEEAHHE